MKNQMEFLAKKALFVLIMCSIGLVLSGCITANAPVTGRTQIMLVSAKQEKSLGLNEADTILKNSNQTANKTLAAKVENIGKKIVGASEEAKQYNWSFYTLEDPTINAFALPGGKVFFYTGILKLMQNDDQIATVMGHEIAHVLARHGAERMSQQMLSSAGSSILATVLNVPPEYKGLYDTAYGMASNIGIILPFSRTHESEADTIGVYLMYKAGYDPNEAVKFWKIMSAQGSSGTPLFLSTHPSDEQRIRDIEEYIKTLK